jgi:predicted nucleotidyltransferase
MIAFGPRSVVAEEFAALQGVEVYIYGSWAARYLGEPGPPPGDVDVLVVGTPSRDAVWEAAERAERRLHKEVNAHVVSPARWEERTEPFLRQVASRPLVRVSAAGSGGPE